MRRVVNTMAIFDNLLWTIRLETFSSFPRIFRATHLYLPASSSRTSKICIRPSNVTLVLLLGNDPFTFDQDIRAAGFPEAEQRSVAVFVSLTVSWEWEIVTIGSEMDSPGSPLIPGIPGIPGGPISPLVLFSPLIPGGPMIPCSPLLPGGPMIPWGPFFPFFPSTPLGPALPGGPGRPRGQIFNFPLFWQIFKLKETMSSNTSLMWAELLKWDGCEKLRFSRWWTLALAEVVDTKMWQRKRVNEIT